LAAIWFLSTRQRAPTGLAAVVRLSTSSTSNRLSASIRYWIAPSGRLRQHAPRAFPTVFQALESPAHRVWMDVGSELSFEVSRQSWSGPAAYVVALLGRWCLQRALSLCLRIGTELARAALTILVIEPRRSLLVKPVDPLVDGHRRNVLDLGNPRGGVAPSRQQNHLGSHRGTADRLADHRFKGLVLLIGGRANRLAVRHGNQEASKTKPLRTKRHERPIVRVLLLTYFDHTGQQRLLDALHESGIRPPFHLRGLYSSGSTCRIRSLSPIEIHRLAGMFWYS
jgi:hypothetical protein